MQITAQEAGKAYGHDMRRHSWTATVAEISGIQAESRLLQEHKARH